MVNNLHDGGSDLSLNDSSLLNQFHVVGAWLLVSMIWPTVVLLWFSFILASIAVEPFALSITVVFLLHMFHCDLSQITVLSTSLGKMFFSLAFYVK